MKGMSEILKSSVSLTFVSYLFLSACKPNQPEWPTGLSNPFTNLKEYFLQILQPRIERSAIQEPETFMTTVNNSTFLVLMKNKRPMVEFSFVCCVTFCKITEVENSVFKKFALTTCCCVVLRSTKNCGASNNQSVNIRIQGLRPQQKPWLCYQISAS